MTFTSIGDLAQSYMLRLQNTELKARMGQLTQELASGRTSDVAKHLSGSYSYLADVERNLTLLEGYDTATGEATLFTAGMQSALERFQTLASGLGQAALSASSGRQGVAMGTTSARAAGDFSLMIATLNTQVAGRSLCAGVATDSPALMSGNEMLGLLRTEIAGETTLAGVEARLDAWFGAGGGFETLAYTGSGTGLAPLQLGRGETIDLDLRADHQSFRGFLKSAAMAALAGDETLAFSADLQLDMMVSASETLAFRQDALIRVRADLGHAQSAPRKARPETPLSERRS